jgi:class 3 adenylate cyclase
MARLSARERAKLPDSAFAYVDTRGKRMLPIHDEPHVRAALSRFEQVKFEDDAARERARTRLLNAAKKYGIVPVGFITGQLRTEREQAARGPDTPPLPDGTVTMMLTDIEGSTALLQQLGDGYAALLDSVRDIIRGAVVGAGGREVEVRADEFFGVFESAPAAVDAAVVIQRTLAQRTLAQRASPDAVDVRVRIGVHTGEITLTEGGYVGLAVHTAARVCSAGHGGQIVVSDATRAAVEASTPTTATAFRSLGRHRLAGLPGTEPLFQAEAEGLRTEFPPLRKGRDPSTHG